MLKTYADGFTGGGLATIGAIAAGLTPLWGIEIDKDIAEVANNNLGGHVLNLDILDVDPHTLPIPDVLHFSPPCPSFSVANNRGGETPLDIAFGQKIAQFIDVMSPKVLTIENVFPYRLSKAFGIITAALNRGGYFWDYDNVNAANFGVPQTRRRLILRAVRGALLPPLPAPEPWVGWLAAIEDLIPTLPDSKFAKWQLARLPDELAKLIPIRPGLPGYWECANCGHKWVSGDRYGLCPNCESDNFEWQMNPAGILVSNAKTEYGDGLRNGQEPAGTITGESNGRTRAFIIDCQKAGDAEGDRSVTLRQGDAPAFTVTGGKGGRQPVRAWLVSDQAGNSGEGVQILDDTQPALTVMANNKGGTSPRAYLVSGGQGDYNGTGCVTTVDGDNPAYTVTAGETKRQSRAWLAQGRVVKLTPRALARFQSVPDSYKLLTNRKQLESFAALLLDIPESLAHFVIERETTDNRLACKVIGNGVPPLLIEKIYRQLVGG